MNLQLAGNDSPASRKEASLMVSQSAQFLRSLFLISESVEQRCTVNSTKK